MGNRTNHPQPSLYMGGVIFCIVFALLVLGGCPPPPPPGPGPGKPDDMQLEHYYMLKSAIEDHNKINALIALDLFKSDIDRWYSDKSMEAVAITDLKTLTEAVDRGEWDAAGKILEETVSKYRPEGE